MKYEIVKLGLSYKIKDVQLNLNFKLKTKFSVRPKYFMGHIYALKNIICFVSETQIEVGNLSFDLLILLTPRDTRTKQLQIWSQAIKCYNVSRGKDKLNKELLICEDIDLGCYIHNKM